jgi:hypothetical protein
MWNTSSAKTMRRELLGALVGRLNRRAFDQAIQSSAEEGGHPILPDFLFIRRRAYEPRTIYFSLTCHSTYFYE